MCNWNCHARWYGRGAKSAEGMEASARAAECMG